MSKKTSYILAILACAIYWILFIVIIESHYGGFEKLGTFWKILFFALPIMGIWKGITGLGKKGKDNGKDNIEN